MGDENENEFSEKAFMKSLDATVEPDPVLRFEL